MPMGIIKVNWFLKSIWGPKTTGTLLCPVPWVSLVGQITDAGCDEVQTELLSLQDEDCWGTSSPARDYPGDRLLLFDYDLVS